MNTDTFLESLPSDAVIEIGMQIWPLIITVDGIIYEIRDAQLPPEVLGGTVSGRMFRRSFSINPR